MMSGIDRRIARLEQAAARLEQAESPPETVYVWADGTLADALAERFPEGQPKNVTVVAYSWADPAPPPGPTKS